jgi:hypothetical protein
MKINSNPVKAERVSRVAHWVSTVFSALALVAIGTADLLRLSTIMESLAHLGYPAYLATILGTWELLGAWAIVAPSRPRIQEWAYAGMFFSLTGAALSHLAAGDHGGKVLFPLVLLGSVMVSWVSRPAQVAHWHPEVASRKIVWDW